VISDDSLVSFAQKLIRQSSFSGEEGAVVELIVEEMQRLGFDRVWVDEIGNAVGMIIGDHPGPTLLMDGHCDTVGIAPGSVWTHDPFGAEIVGDMLYGRGAADMKGAIAAMVHGTAIVDRGHLAGQVAVSASVMEENLEGAALQPVIETMQPNFVVIGEATDLNLNRGGRGRAEIHLETIGRPAHSSSPQLGRNAVLDMMKVIGAIGHIPIRTDPLLGEAVMVLTDIISEPYPAYSVIPSRCRVTYDRRVLLDETPERILDVITSLPELAGIDLHARIAEGQHQTYTGAVLRGTKFLHAWALEENHPFVKTCIYGLHRAGLQPMMGTYRFCTNAAYSAGVAKIPTVGFGPGREEDAHVVNERLDLRSLVAAEQGYRSIIEATLECPKG